MLPLSFCNEPLRKLLVGNSRFSSEILFDQGFLQVHLGGEISRNCHALSTSPNTQGMVSIDIRHFPLCRLLSCFLFELQWFFALTFLNSFCSHDRQ